MWGTLPAKNILERPDESIVIASDDSSETQSFELFVSSWNVGGIEPPDDFDMGDLLNIHKNTADIYVLGFQEIVPLNAGSIIASENSSVSYKWNSLIRSALNKRASSTITIQKAEAGECQKVCPLHRDAYFNSAAAAFECIASKQMVGVFVTIWARTQIHHYINHIDVSCVGCGIFGRIGNKGSVSVRFRLHETTFCFVCSHLASGGNKGDEKHRNTDATQILSRTRFPSRPSQALPRKIVDHDRVIWLGDLNYRIYLPEATTRSLVNDGQWSILLQNDQLKSELTEGHVFEGWHEEEIKFAPTYKYNTNSEDYYDCDQKRHSKKCRTPAWCDRIISFGNGLKQKHYDRCESRLSDHRPVRGIFTAEVKLARSFIRGEVKKLLAKD
nr:type IV inositol polyphosphate 5-phosphatase 9-like isoform X1 [Ipomoea batatas]